MPGGKRVVTTVFVTAALGLVAAACSKVEPATTASPTPAGSAATAGTTTVPYVYPDPDFRTATPVAKRVDPGVLQGLVGAMNNGASNCLVTLKGGEIVQEDYWNGTNQDTRQEIFSASKSITSSLVGIAQAQGKLNIDDKASKYITEWQGTPSESVTIKNLLSNNSGREWDFQTDYVKMAIGAPDKSTFALGLGQQFPPGDHWEYNNSAIQTLEVVLKRATGLDAAEFAKKNLFEPIGMGSKINRDSAGNPLMFMGVQASCRDLARYGYLYLREGKWKDQQVVPAAWVKDSTTPSQKINVGYGYLWWVNGKGHLESGFGPPSDGQAWPDLPTDSYAALGLGNQIVYVVPSRDLVIVRLGGQAAGGVGAQGDLLNVIAKHLPK